jgi:hypothetical protein
MMNVNQISIILGVLMILLLGIIGYLVWTNKTLDQQLIQQSNNINRNTEGSINPITSDTNTVSEIDTQKFSTIIPTDWEVYTNSKYKFSIGYPKNWSVIDSSSGALSVSRTESCKKDNFQTLEQFMDQYRECERFTVWAGDTSAANFTDTKDENYFKVNIGGIEGQKFIYNLAMQGFIDGQSYYIPRATIDGQVQKNGVIYKFSMVLHQQNINRAIKEFDSFLASFQFLD